METKKVKIGLLGASFDTGNLGVSALAESTIKMILHKWPNAEVTILGSGYAPREHKLVLYQKQAVIKNVPIRFSKNIFLPYHFMWFALYGLLSKCLPRSTYEKSLVKRNPYFRTLYETDFAVDITGGDSFSDIYGMHRFMLGFLCKWLIILLGKDLFFLPQTYGPFKRKTARIMAKYILNRASKVYSRDRDSLEYVKNLLKLHNENEKIRFAPDVAFILDPREPEHLDVGSLLTTRKSDSVVVGFNVSGLLYNGGYTKNNMFELKTNYARLVLEIIESILQDAGRLVLLVPHVYPQPEYEVESDVNACMKIYEQLGEKYKGRMFVARGLYNQNEIKHIIGLCDFFIGSRMHSCIAAMSQYIPAVGIAYSKKFNGVFESVGMGGYVADARSLSTQQVLNIIKSALAQKDGIRKHLELTIPNVQNEIYDLFRQSNNIKP